MRDVKLPAVIGTRLEAESATDLRRLAALSGRTVAEELRTIIRERLLVARNAGLFPGHRPEETEPS
jgi:hypothetical protein